MGETAINRKQAGTILTKMASFGRDMLTSGSAACIARTAMAPMERVKLLLQLQAVSQQIPRKQQYKVSCPVLVLQLLGTNWRFPKHKGTFSCKTQILI